ncbi:MAG: 2,3-bisphosphoglycerate-dependent phosphoglycerate mutase [Candidatus Saccharimonadia bacterium]
MSQSGLLVILRHGESEWNARGVWTGLTDVHLTENGRAEAVQMGEMIKDLHFDQAFASEQIRTHETLDGVLSAIHETTLARTYAKAFNERDYGIYTGKNKWEVEQAIGHDKFIALRRGWNYPVEHGESLREVYARTIPYYKSHVVPLLLSGKNVLIVAHGNSIRSLQKYIENIDNAAIAQVEMIFGSALIYTVDKTGRQKSKNVRKIDVIPPPA